MPDWETIAPVIRWLGCIYAHEAPSSVCKKFPCPYIFLPPSKGMKWKITGIDRVGGGGAALEPGEFRAKRASATSVT
jgi:hypothetical protein